MMGPIPHKFSIKDSQECSQRTKLLTACLQDQVRNGTSPHILLASGVLQRNLVRVLASSDTDGTSCLALACLQRASRPARQPNRKPYILLRLKRTNSSTPSHARTLALLYTVPTQNYHSHLDFEASSTQPHRISKPFSRATLTDQ